MRPLSTRPAEISFCPSTPITRYRSSLTMQTPYLRTLATPSTTFITSPPGKEVRLFLIPQEYNQTMSAALGLYRLQQVDSQIDQIQSRLKAIRQILENDDELRAASTLFSVAENNEKEAERLLKQIELEVEKQRIKIQQTEASLYGGLVKNPKELQDLQKDIASLKRHLETLEERQF